MEGQVGSRLEEGTSMAQGLAARGGVLDSGAPVFSTQAGC